MKKLKKMRWRKIENLNKSNKRRSFKIKKKHFSTMLITILQAKKNSFRICRFIIDTQINFNFYFTRLIFNINIFENIFHIYQQLFHVRFFDIFVQFALIEIIEKFDRNKLNKLKWQYQSFFFQNEVSSKKNFIFIFNNLNSCQLFDLQIRIRLSLFNNNFFQNNNSIISTSSVKFKV